MFYNFLCSYYDDDSPRVAVQDLLLIFRIHPPSFEARVAIRERYRHSCFPTVEKREVYG